MRHLRKTRVRKKSLKPPPENGLGLTVPMSGMEEGSSPALAESKVQRQHHPGNFHSRPLSLLFYLALYSSVLAHDHIQGYLIFLVLFFRGCINCIKPAFCSRRQTTCGWRQAIWKLKASNKWSLWWPNQRLRACMTSS